MHHSALRKFLKGFCMLVLSFLWLTGSGQFIGGPDDGVSFTSAFNQNLGQNIYKGGPDDGQSLSFAANQMLGQNIYKGGTDDGQAYFFAANQPLGQNIYRGGLDDGTVFGFASNQPLGQNIFMGGVNDGHGYSFVANASLGQNIYLGGSNDGWAFAFGQNLVLVPANLKSFDANWQDDEDVRTHWITTSEINTRHFIVERSIDGTHFDPAATIPAAGNSGSDINYHFVDLRVNNHYNVRPTHFYYRLKTVDLSGEFSYSAIVLLPNKGASNADMFVVYPNPAQQFITIEFKGNSMYGQQVIQLYSNDGKVLLQQPMRNSRETIQVGRYPSGTYYISLLNRETKKTQTLKFIIQH